MSPFTVQVPVAARREAPDLHPTKLAAVRREARNKREAIMKKKKKKKQKSKVQSMNKAKGAKRKKDGGDGPRKKGRR